MPCLWNFSINFTTNMTCLGAVNLPQYPLRPVHLPVLKFFLAQSFSSSTGNFRRSCAAATAEPWAHPEDPNYVDCWRWVLPFHMALPLAIEYCAHPSLQPRQWIPACTVWFRIWSCIKILQSQAHPFTGSFLATIYQPSSRRNYDNGL